MLLTMKPLDSSISAILIITILALVLVFWLPLRTVDSMKKVMQHRQDRFSTFLRLIDPEDGKRFSDGQILRCDKEFTMQQNTRAMREIRERVAKVRHLRAQAIRRRRILVGVLLLATVILAVLSWLTPLTAWSTLAPLALLILVLALGVKTARDARAWEKRVAQQLADLSPSSHPTRPSNVTRPLNSTFSANKISQSTAEKSSRSSESSVSVAAKPNATPMVLPLVIPAEKSIDSANDSANLSAALDDENDVPTEVIAQQQPAYELDGTHEVAQIMPAGELDVFDMATNQELISFSLDASATDDQAPRSLEIQSYRQVARAIPLHTDDLKASSSDGELQSEEVHAYRPIDQELEKATQQSKVNGEVEDLAVEDVSSESLSLTLEEILARRHS